LDTFKGLSFQGFV